MPPSRISLRCIFSAAFATLLIACRPAMKATVAPTLAEKSPTAGRTAVPSASNPPAEQPPRFSIALGGNHTCALTVEHGAVCWGNNRYGQLGNGSIVNSAIPADVSRLTGGVKTVAAGWAHSCAVRDDGSLECWGTNAKGQLGNSTTVDSRSPAAVSGLGAGVKAVAAGHRHTCALMETGGVKCWGENASGGLGDGTNINRSDPVDVPELTGGVTALEAGAGHTCALLESGAVRCWGWNVNGQLGNGTTVDSRSPMEVGPLPGPARAIAAGDQHTCALIEGGSVVCWGANTSGQLGNGTRARSNSPAAVVGLSSVVELAAGGAHTCARLESGAVKCWGDDQSGQLGDGGYANQSRPVDVGGLPADVGRIAAGFSHTCATLDDGRILCWGWNAEGQLGDGTVKSRRTPAGVVGFSGGPSVVAVGWSNVCALQSLAGVRCWGLNSGGQLGNGSNADSASPVDVDGLRRGSISVAVGGAHACALSAAGGVKCWGRNDRGQLGDGAKADRNTPADVVGLPEAIAAVAAGKEHTCALTVRGGVKCWGANAFGQLGDGTPSDSDKPVDVAGLSQGVADIAAGANHTCALGRSGGLKCWGSNAYGQLGDGTQEDRRSPVDVSGLSAEVNSIAAGGSHTCAIAAGTTLKCWGWNAYGQLGDSTPTDRSVPTDVQWLAGAAGYVTAGFDFTCAVMRAGNLRCWGNNEFGQLGDGTADVHHTPIDVRGVSPKVRLLAAGAYTACAIGGDEKLKCWGNNLYGQLGNGAATNSNVPVDVIGLE